MAATSAPTQADQTVNQGCLNVFLLHSVQIMLTSTFSAATVALYATCAASSLAPASFGPESARENAPLIFNALHNAMRQFGSSLHHNGMSFFPAIIPSGTLLYHGTWTTEIPTTYEWLAFEVEHAENFASTKWWRPRPPPGTSDLREDGQVPFLSTSGDDAEVQISRDWKQDIDFGGVPESGYLHIYQATRPLKLLYIDGMAAGKTNLGTNDAEDYILTGNKNTTEDMIRGKDLCNLSKEWQIDGVIRMEPGFEVIYCDFSNGGLSRVSANRRPVFKERDNVDEFLWIQAASQRYHGIGGGRVVVDYSSMVSAFFYPVNLTNPNVTRAELPRLISASEDELIVIREHVDRVIRRAQSNIISTIDWQGVTDMVVARYSERLRLLAWTDSLDLFRSVIDGLLNMFIDYSTEEVDLELAQGTCAKHFVLHLHPTTPEDDLIYAGIEGTARSICQALFRARELAADSNADSASLQEAVTVTVQLMNQLRWSEWKECSPCLADEVCYIAMWPFGNVEDHYNPSCRNISTIYGRYSYWEGASNW
ncbi:hypothetical protein BJ170DRAFT_630266 [Xylariales sp. AK1849]|nr:hypothetical protein BJ170DRAFT_630266 [Xylariales sp. AK1849]